MQYQTKGMASDQHVHTYAQVGDVVAFTSFDVHR
jgi:hypothetical protein